MEGYDLNGQSLGGFTFADDVDGDGELNDLTAIYCEGSVRSAKTAGSVNGDVWIGGSGTALKALSVKNGNMEGDVWVAGAAGKITIGGSGAGDAVAAGGSLTIAGTDGRGFSLKSLSVQGDFAGMLETDGSVRRLTINAGDFKGVVEVDGDLGTFRVRESGGDGGDMDEGARVSVTGLLKKLCVDGSIDGDNEPQGLVQILASFIGDAKIRRRVENCRILAGLDLGSDWTLGGVGDAADTYCAGVIRKIGIGGDAINCLVGAGLVPCDGEFDLQWLEDNEAFLEGSSIGCVAIEGMLLPDFFGDTDCGVGAYSIGQVKVADLWHQLVFFLERL
jgi:hypothetical protein